MRSLLKHGALSHGAMKHGAIAVAALGVAATPAAAAVVGDTVRVETTGGEAVVGRLVAETGRGLLVAGEDGNRMVEYGEVARLDVVEAPVSAAPGLAVADAPPRPRVGGDGAVVTGWVLTGIGAVGGLSALADNDGLSRTLGLVTAGLFLGGGAGCLVGGYATRAADEEALRAWEAAQGDRRVSIAPAALPGGGGAVLSMGF